MPRGSKIGERRGGRARGTPNRRSALVDRMLAVASGRPATSACQFVVMLASDQELAADIRMAIARKFCPLANHREAPAAQPMNLEIEFNIVQDITVPADQRRKAASQIAQHILPRKAGPKRWWVNAPKDQCEFAITPEIAAEYRDAKFGVRRLSDSGSNSPRTTNKIEKLRARMNAILRRLQCPRPSRYGQKERKEDTDRVIDFLYKRQANESLSAEENAEEAHRRARLDAYNEGPESAARGRLYKLEEKARSARARRPRLTRKERTDLRFLRVLYPRHIEPYDPDKDPSYHPLRDAPVAEDGNLYRRDSKLRPPKDGEIEEEFVDIPDTAIHRVIGSGKLTHSATRI